MRFYNNIVVFLLALFLSNDGFTSNDYSQNTYGSVGLIQTPTARFDNDGEFLFGVSTEAPYNRIYSKMQFFPWLEAILRYSEGEHTPYNAGSKQTWKDKGIDIKIKLLDESERIPQIAIGLMDIGGTGSWAAEYIVANKAYKNFDFSLGLGWGRFGGKDMIKNPMGILSNRFTDLGRGSKYSTGGGTLSLGNLFTGQDISIFGGLQYKTPIENLSLKIEYDTSNYIDIEGVERKLFQTGDIIDIDSRINYSLDYSLPIGNGDQGDFSLGFVRGNTIYANLAIHSNLNTRRNKKFVAPKEVINVPYLEPFSDLDDSWKEYLSDLIMWQMGNVGFVTHEIFFNENELKVEISQARFQDTVQAIELASRILANNSPKNISKITVINIDQGIETLRASIPRDSLVKSVSMGPIDEELLEFNKSTKNENNNALSVKNRRLYPNFYWEIKPHMLGTLQHQIQFYFWQLEALVHSEYSIKKGLYLSTDIGINIANNYDDYTYHIPDGQLYHVRQDRRLYLTEGESGLRKMALDYLMDISPNLKAKITAGYLEWMYGGFGGELLYMPESKNWGVSFDTYWLKQRDYDQKFSFKDYQTVTAFVNFYYDMPFYNMRLKTSVGKFLAKDKGFTLDLSRRYTSGARVGARLALTDCDAACVGEGSFNKWIYFNLPMDLFYINSSTRGKSGFTWSPLTKDAGQKVDNGNLYDLVVHAQDEVDSLRKPQWSFKKIVSGFSTSPKKI